MARPKEPRVRAEERKNPARAERIERRRKLFGDPFIVRESRFVSETSAGERSHAAEPPKCTDTRRNSPRTFLPSLPPPPSPPPPPLPPASLPWTRLVHFDSIVRRADAAPCAPRGAPRRRSGFAPARVLSAPRCRTERFRRGRVRPRARIRCARSEIRAPDPLPLAESRKGACPPYVRAGEIPPPPSLRPCSFPHVVANFPSTQRPARALSAFDYSLSGTDTIRHSPSALVLREHARRKADFAPVSELGLRK